MNYKVRLKVGEGYQTILIKADSIMMIPKIVKEKFNIEEKLIESITNLIYE